jgi:hypothetical protein
MGRMLFFHQQGEIQPGRSTANNTNPHAAKAPALKGSLIVVMPSPVGDKRRRTKSVLSVVRQHGG